MAGQTYMARRRTQVQPSAPAPPAQGPSLQALRAGAAPTQEQLGSRVDLPGAIREKMEASFGADLSGVRLYESQAVADAGARAMAMGNRVAFAPGQLDLASTAGQSLLGHELSHVVSQARGEVPGSGFLNDSALEARADREGALAAAGESVYTGPVTPLSASSVISAAGPMQAKKSGKKDKAPAPPAAAAPVPAPAPAPAPAPVQFDPGRRLTQEEQYAMEGLGYSGASRRAKRFQEEIEFAKQSMGPKADKRFKNLNANPLLKEHLIASLPVNQNNKNRSGDAINVQARHRMFEGLSSGDPQEQASVLAEQIKMLQKTIFNPDNDTGLVSYANMDALDHQNDSVATGMLSDNGDMLTMLRSLKKVMNASAGPEGRETPLFSTEQLGFQSQEARDAFQLNMDDYLTSADEAAISAKKILGQQTDDPRSLEELKQARFQRRVNRIFRLGNKEALQHFTPEQFLEAGPNKQTEEDLDEIMHYARTKKTIQDFGSPELPPPLQEFADRFGIKRAQNSIASKAEAIRKADAEAAKKRLEEKT